MSSNIPNHIAFIMDGNGRWANRRGLPRSMGHQKGAEALRRVVEAGAEIGIPFMTFFGFSSENWSRPEQEIKELMRLLRYYLRAETAELHKNNIRLRVIGDRQRFDEDIIALIENAEALTKDNARMTVVIALNYGGRHDILQAAFGARQNENFENFASDFEANLMTADIPEPDLLVRTSGEMRISNFLLWQCAYAEFYFCDTLWPDFDRAALEKAIEAYAGRERRFGGLKRHEGS